MAIVLTGLFEAQRATQNTVGQAQTGLASAMASGSGHTIESLSQSFLKSSYENSNTSNKPNSLVGVDSLSESMDDSNVFSEGDYDGDVSFSRYLFFNFCCNTSYCLTL